MEKTVIDSFKGKYAFLDNDFPCFIYHDCMRFSSCNRAYHASKSFDVRHRIGCMLAPDSKTVRTLGRKVELREDWDKIKLKLMYELLEKKFSDPELKQLLLDTGDAELIWKNRSDKFWGVVNGEGENWLGKHLMNIRKKMKK